MFAAMKDLGIESDEDVGLGLDFEEDEDEFRKCIEDDVPVETSRTKLEESDSTPQPRRRLIMADISLHLSSSFDEDELDDSQVSSASEQPHSLPVQLRHTPQRPTRLHWQYKKGNVEGTPEVTTTAILKQKLERRHSITVCESPSRPSRPSLSRGSSVHGSQRPDRLPLHATTDKENWSVVRTGNLGKKLMEGALSNGQWGVPAESACCRHDRN